MREGSGLPSLLYYEEAYIMDVQAIATLVGSLGFPIAACIYLGVFLTKTINEFKDSMQTNTGAIRELTIYVNELRKELEHEREP